MTLRSDIEALRDEFGTIEDWEAPLDYVAYRLTEILEANPEDYDRGEANIDHMMRHAERCRESEYREALEDVFRQMGFRALDNETQERLERIFAALSDKKEQE
jgi:hypothetical protein